jgi:hypothetical protein
MYGVFTNSELLTDSSIAQEEKHMAQANETKKVALFISEIGCNGAAELLLS